MGIKVTVRGRLLNNATFKARENEQNGKKEFSALVVLEDGEHKKLEKARDKAVSEKWGDKPPVKRMDYVVREGDDPDFENTFEHMFINAKTLRPPKALRKLRDGTFERLTGEESTPMIYAGCYVYVSVDVYCYDANKTKKSPPGITCGLGGLLHWKHGENLGGDLNVDEAFGGDDIVVEDDDDEDSEDGDKSI